MRRPAFTLVELLVVISIIVVLLAMLTPAMDKALRQAGMASCAANLDAVASGITSYAYNSRRNYPYRPRGRAGVWILSQLYDGNPTRYNNEADPTKPQDDRRIIEGYVSLDAFIDPLCEPIDLDPDYTDPDSICFSSNAQLWGLQIAGPGGTLSGMFKIGQTLNWRHDYGQGPRLYKFKVLATDFITRSIASDPEAQASHPDADGMLSEYTLQNTPHNNTFLGVPQSQNANLSIWRRVGSPQHGPIDLNTAYDDGSVQRLKKHRAPRRHHRHGRRGDPHPRLHQWRVLSQHRLLPPRAISPQAHDPHTDLGTVDPSGSVVVLHRGRCAHPRHPRHRHRHRCG